MIESVVGVVTCLLIYSTITDYQRREIDEFVWLCIIVLGVISSGIYALLFPLGLFAFFTVLPNRLSSFVGAGDLKLIIGMSALLDPKMLVLWLIISLGFAILHNLFNQLFFKDKTIGMALDFLLGFISFALLFY